MSDQPQFKPGDVVYLITGSQAMVVTEPHPKNTVVAWYEPQGLQLISFPNACLTTTRPAEAA